jgi:hypothetical protein
MSIISVTDLPDWRNLLLYEVLLLPEKRADVRMSGLLQITASNYLIVAVPTALVRGIFDAMHEPGISLPGSIDGGAVRAGIVVMTPEEVAQVGGADRITERGKHYTYTLGSLQETPAVNWPGVSTCWHLKVKSSDLGQLRRSYGLPTKLEGDSDFSIVVACRKMGVLSANTTSKTTTQSQSNRLPDWTLPSR